jgi:hypothetical protein
VADPRIYEDFFDIEEIEEEGEEEDEDELTLQGLQELIRNLLKRVAKLECHHAKL